MSEFFDLEVMPLAQIMRLDAGRDVAWRAYGDDPAFRCVWAGARSLQGGWYLVDLEVEVSRGAIHAPCLYPGYSRGDFLESESVILPLYGAYKGKHHVRKLVLFPRDVAELRFDPSTLPCEFALRKISLRRMGRLAAAREMIAGLLQRRQRVAGKVSLLLSAAINVLRGGPRRMADKLYAEYVEPPAARDSTDYAIWLDFYDNLTPEVLERAGAEVEHLPSRPKVSVVVPVYNAPERWLRACIDSVLAQVYPDWELCIADDASTQPHVRRLLEEFARADSRIKLFFRERNGHISEASNSALTLATGDYVAFLDHDDALHPLALLECVKAFQANPSWRMLFTDEDKIDERGLRSDPFFKSDWNPDLFLSQNCVCHLSVYERGLVESVGGFRGGYEGAQDWDLTLRVAERLRAEEIGHLPKVLYHWRMIEGSTALSPGEKSYAHYAAMRALQDHLDRVNKDAKVVEMPGYSGYFRIEYALPKPPPLVSLLVPTRDRVDLLRQCVTSILEKTDYPDYEIIILDNGSREAETKEYLRALVSDRRIRVEPYDHPFNYSAINNHGAKLARGSVLGLLNNDIEVITPHWLREMASHAVRPEIGVVGAMLYYPNDTIQHAGVVLGIGGVAGHAYARKPRGYPGLRHRAGLAQSLSAVTAACAVLRAATFAAVGGLDEKLVVAFNDIDLCLRVRAAGYRNLWTPYAELYHHESATRGYEHTPEKIARFKREERFMQHRWGRALLEDPYYNPNFALNMTPYSLAFPPRVSGERSELAG